MSIDLNKYFENYIDNNYEKLDNDNYKKLEKEVSDIIKNENIVYLDFDGGFGYTINFINMILGYLIDKFGREVLTKKLEVISNDEPSISEYVFDLLKN